MKRKVNKESFEDVVMWALRRECAGHEIEEDDSLYGDLGLDSIDITDMELTIEKKLKSPHIPSSYERIALQPKYCLICVKRLFLRQERWNPTLFSR